MGVVIGYVYNLGVDLRSKPLIYIALKENLQASPYTYTV
jgi:hypothetical protein